MFKIFETLVAVTGIVGALANGLMLFCFVRSRQKSDSSIPILNQMIMDLFTSCFLVVTYGIRISSFDFEGAYLGSFVCKVFASQAGLFSAFNSSIANLLLLSFERYTKVVHPMFHRKHFRRWIYGLAVFLAWTDVPALFNAVVTASTSIVENGQCLGVSKFPTQTHRTAFAVWSLFSFFIAPLVILVYCYAMMLRVTRKRARVAVNFNNMIRTSAQQTALRIQLNVIKTFLIVSVCFVVCWFPNRTVFFLFNIGVLKVLETNILYTTVFMAIVSVCLNPFIYAAQLDPVRRYLHRMFHCCRRRSVDDLGNVAQSARFAVGTVSGVTAGSAVGPQ